MAQVTVELNSEELGALDRAMAEGETRETYCERVVKAALAAKKPKAPPAELSEAKPHKVGG